MLNYFSTGIFYSSGGGMQKNSRRYMKFAALLFFAANTILFCFTSRALHAIWQPIKMTKKHPAPPPPLTYNG